MYQFTYNFHSIYGNFKINNNGFVTHTFLIMLSVIKLLFRIKKIKQTKCQTISNTLSQHINFQLTLHGKHVC